MAEKKVKINGREKENRVAVGIVFFVIILIVLSLLFTTVVTMRASVKMVEVPQVKIAVQSKDGSETKNVSAKFTIKTESKEVQNIDKNILASEIGEAMRDIDYDELSDVNGTEYVKAVVKEQLSRKYGDAIDEVYISDFINDVKIPSKDDQDNKNDNDLNKTLEGIANTKR